ncbi:hypothetical protein BKA70DRAFT_1330882 [Coprinopsis sp. MPI-PUGE-AT-0042]|nr:hypothetical protein BKA70DRAFT_1330882 [Coprinopsis sp. MPI-PUGE-AT-0042]
MITLYDIPSTKNKPWSPNTWKTRYSLNYKNLPYRTVWVEYPDIATIYRTNNIPPAEIRPGGFEYYSLPLIRDDTSGQIVYVAESFQIAKYLDKTYPDTPRLIPDRQEAEKRQAAVPGMVFMKLLGLGPLALLMKDTKTNLLNKASHEHFTLARGRDLSAAFGGITSPDEIEFSEEKRKETWKEFKKSLDGWSEKFGGKESFSWYEGEKISFADFAVAAVLLLIKVLYGEDSEVWGQVKSWNEGKWEKLLEQLSDYHKNEA